MSQSMILFSSTPNHHTPPQRDPHTHRLHGQLLCRRVRASPCRGGRVLMALLPRLKPSLRRAPLPPEPTYTAPPAYAPRMRARPARWKSTAAQRHIPPHICAHCFLPSARGGLPQGFCVCSAPHVRREHRRTAPARLRLLPVPPRIRARPARWKSTAAQRHIPPHICAHCFLPSARGVLPQGFCVCSAPHARREHRRTAPARLRLLPVPPRIRAMRKGQNTARARAASPQFHRPVLVLSPSERI